MMGYWGNGMLGGEFWGGIGMIFVWVGVIFFAVWIIREVAGGRKENDKKDPLEILRERYAKGEMTKEEFESKKKDLGY